MRVSPSELSTFPVTSVTALRTSRPPVDRGQLGSIASPATTLSSTTVGLHQQIIQTLQLAALALARQRSIEPDAVLTGRIDASSALLDDAIRLLNLANLENRIRPDDHGPTRT